MNYAVIVNNLTIISIEQQKVHFNNIHELQYVICENSSTVASQINALSLQPNDTIYFYNFELMGNDLEKTLEFIEKLIKQSITIKAGALKLEQSPETEQILKSMFLAVEFSKAQLKERLQRGKEKAKEKGGFKEGAQSKYSAEQLQDAIQLLDEFTYEQVAEKTGISISTLYRAKKKVIRNE